MAPSQPPSFDSIIQAGRQKKRNEDLANEIFGKGRRSSTPSGYRTSGKVAGSLASRISKPGQPVRAASHSSLNKAVKRPQVTQTRSTAPKNDLFEHLSHPEPPARTPELGSGFNIRGIAGPACVVGRNFAPGTSAADIQSAMEQIGGEMQSCTIISTHPTVTAEMIFPDKANADTVIATFDNQKADGRILRLFLKKGPPTVLPSAPVQQTYSQSRSNSAPYAETSPAQTVEYPANTNVSRRAEPEVHDGSFGFNATQDSDQMAVDADIAEPEPAPSSVPEVRAHEGARDEPRGDRRGPRHGYDRRDDRRENGQYSQYQRPDNRDYRRGPPPPQHPQGFRGYDARDNRDNRGLYSDGLYSRPRGRGGYR